MRSCHHALWQTSHLHKPNILRHIFSLISLSPSFKNLLNTELIEVPTRLRYKLGVNQSQRFDAQTGAAKSTSLAVSFGWKLSFTSLLINL